MEERYQQQLEEDDDSGWFVVLPHVGTEESGATSKNDTQEMVALGDFELKFDSSLSKSDTQDIIISVDWETIKDYAFANWLISKNYTVDALTVSLFKDLAKTYYSEYILYCLEESDFLAMQFEEKVLITEFIKALVDVLAIGDFSHSKVEKNANILSAATEFINAIEPFEPNETMHRYRDIYLCGDDALLKFIVYQVVELDSILSLKDDDDEDPDDDTDLLETY